MAPVLAHSLSTSRAPVALGRPLGRSSSRLVIARAGPKVTREYREDDDSIIVPGEENKASTSKGNGPLYADQVQQQMRVRTGCVGKDLCVYCSAQTFP